IEEEKPINLSSDHISPVEIKPVSLESILNSSNDKKDDVVDEIKPVLNNRLEKLVKKVDSLNLKDPLKNTMVNPLESLEVNNPFESLITKEDDDTNIDSNYELEKNQEKENLNEETTFLEAISQESLDETEADLSLVMRDESFEHDNAISISSESTLEGFSLEGLTSKDVLNNDNYYNQSEEENDEVELVDEKPTLLPVKVEEPWKKELNLSDSHIKVEKKNNKNDLKKEIKNVAETPKKPTSKNSKDLDNAKGSFEVIHKGKVKEVTLNDIIRSGPRSSQNEEAIKYFNLAKDLCVKGNYKLALIELEEAVKIDPAYEEAHILLSRTYLKLKSMNLVWMKN
ncbi:MAG: tetratricopeptide repeat protein, partial [Candidatus Sericytochromatia bacterium]